MEPVQNEDTEGDNTDNQDGEEGEEKEANVVNCFKNQRQSRRTDWPGGKTIRAGQLLLFIMLSVHCVHWRNFAESDGISI
jgi:hypothetical protein